MSKIDERHDNELVEAVKLGNIEQLEKQYNNSLKNAILDNAEILEQLHQKIMEVSKQNLESIESLDRKIEENHQRKMRYNHVFSLNFKVGANKSHEFGNFIASKTPNPEETLMKKDEETEQKEALSSLDSQTQIIFQTYLELGFYPENKDYPKHENWSKLSRALEAKGIKLTKNKLKKAINTAQRTLKSLLQ